MLLHCAVFCLFVFKWGETTKLDYLFQIMPAFSFHFSSPLLSVYTSFSPSILRARVPLVLEDREPRGHSPWLHRQHLSPSGIGMPEARTNFRHVLRCVLVAANPAELPCNSLKKRPKLYLLFSNSSLLRLNAPRQTDIRCRRSI